MSSIMQISGGNSISISGGNSLTLESGIVTLLPTQVSNLLFWYDFSDISTLWQDQGRTIPVTANGQLIHAVTDKSGNNRHLTSINGGPLIYNSSGQNSLGTGTSDHTTHGGFQGLDTLAHSTPSQPYVYFIASTTPQAAATRSVIVDQNGCGGFRFFYRGDSGTGVQWGNTIALTTSLPHNVFKTVTAEANGGSSNVYDNNSVDTTGNMGTGPWSQHRIGGNCSNAVNDGPAIEIGEVFAHDALVSASDRNGLQNYLRTKWGT